MRRSVTRIVRTFSPPYYLTVGCINIVVAEVADRMETETAELPVDLPDRARAVLGCWRAARTAAGSVPDIADFAPFQVPPALLPWVTTLRRTGPDSLEYRIVGEELTFLYGSNPRGLSVVRTIGTD